MKPEPSPTMRRALRKLGRRNCVEYAFCRDQGVQHATMDSLAVRRLVTRYRDQHGHIRVVATPEGRSAMEVTR